MSRVAKAKKLLVKGLIVLVSLTVVLELLFRALLFTAEVTVFQNPALFALSSADDLYWRLERRWSKKVEDRGKVVLLTDPTRVHPGFGWSQEASGENNPLGLREEERKKLEGEGKKVASLGITPGASMHQGSEVWSKAVGSQLPTGMLIDLTVPEYGLDQSYLLFKEIVTKLRGSTVLFSISPQSIDSLALNYTVGKKPTLKKNLDSALVRPIQADFKEWSSVPFTSSPSVLFNALKMGVVLDKYKAEIPVSPTEEFFDSIRKKESLARAIYSEISNLCRTHQIVCGVVSVPNPGMLERETWQERLISLLSDESRLKLIDGEKALRKEIVEREIGVQALFRGDMETLNSFGVSVLARRTGEDLEDFFHLPVNRAGIDDIKPAYGAKIREIRKRDTQQWLDIELEITNIGEEIWNGLQVDPFSGLGVGEIQRLRPIVPGCQIFPKTEKRRVPEVDSDSVMELRAHLRRDIAPGESFNATFSLDKSTLEKGTFEIRCNLVKEYTFWFHKLGSVPYRATFIH